MGGGGQKDMFAPHTFLWGGGATCPPCPPPPPRFRRHWLSQSICLTWADFTPSVQCAVPVYLFWPEPISPLRYSVLSRSICFDLSWLHSSVTVCRPSHSFIMDWDDTSGQTDGLGWHRYCTRRVDSAQVKWMDWDGTSGQTDGLGWYTVIPEGESDQVKQMGWDMIIIGVESAQGCR